MPKFKAVIDTNVMVSVAFAKEGLAKELRNMIAEGAFTLVTSKEILAEVYRVLHYPHILKQFTPSKDDIDEFIGMIIEHALITKGSYSIHKIKDDSIDNMFLACALEAKADFIISRDKHLRNLKDFQGIKIIDLTTFLETIKRQKE
jgi:putative PIN family toxin of toxin-antitoxin system